MVTVLDAAHAGCATTREGPDFAPLLSALRSHAQWETQHLHPLLEAHCPGDSLPLAAALAALAQVAEAIELDMCAARDTSQHERPGAWQRAVRHLVRLVDQQQQHLDALEQLDLEALAQPLGGAPRRRAATADMPPSDPPHRMETRR
jgi:hypothetical protein